MTEEFTKELESLLNRHGVDNALGTPDFILAETLVEHLDTLRDALRKRERWFGRVAPEDTLSEKLGLAVPLGEDIMDPGLIQTIEEKLATPPGQLIHAPEFGQSLGEVVAQDASVDEDENPSEG
jgi:hypothetical protein